MRTTLLFAIVLIIGCKKESTPAPSPVTPQQQLSYFVLDGNGFTQDTFYTNVNYAQLDTTNNVTWMSLQDTSNNIHQALAVNLTTTGSGQVTTGAITAADTSLQFWSNPITLTQYTSTTVSGTYGGYCLYSSFPYDTVNITGTFTATRN